MSGDIHNLNSVGIKVRLKINDLNYGSSSCKIIFLRMKEMQFWLINSLYRKKDKIYDLRKYRVSSKSNIIASICIESTFRVAADETLCCKLIEKVKAVS